MQHIEIMSDLYPSDHIFICDRIGVNTIQKYCFRFKRVPEVRVLMDAEGLLVVAN